MRGAIADVAAQFEALRPNLAHAFPFELDTFQKEAILHIEQVRATNQGASTACARVPFLSLGAARQGTCAFGSMFDARVAVGAACMGMTQSPQAS